jgi:hypothetical protein
MAKAFFWLPSRCLCLATAAKCRLMLTNHGALPDIELVAPFYVTESATAEQTCVIPDAGHLRVDPSDLSVTGREPCR